MKLNSLSYFYFSCQVICFKHVHITFSLRGELKPELLQAASKPCFHIFLPRVHVKIQCMYDHGDSLTSETEKVPFLRLPQLGPYIIVDCYNHRLIWLLATCSTRFIFDTAAQRSSQKNILSTLLPLESLSYFTSTDDKIDSVYQHDIKFFTILFTHFSGLAGQYPFLIHAPTPLTGSLSTFSSLWVSQHAVSTSRNALSTWRETITHLPF